MMLKAHMFALLATVMGTQCATFRPLGNAIILRCSQSLRDNRAILYILCLLGPLRTCAASQLCSLPRLCRLSSFFSCSTPDSSLCAKMRARLKAFCQALDSQDGRGSAAGITCPLQLLQHLPPLSPCSCRCSPRRPARRPAPQDETPCSHSGCGGPRGAVRTARTSCSAWRHHTH